MLSKLYCLKKLYWSAVQYAYAVIDLDPTFSEGYLALALIEFEYSSCHVAKAILNVAFLVCSEKDKIVNFLSRFDYDTGIYFDKGKRLFLCRDNQLNARDLTVNEQVVETRSKRVYGKRKRHLNRFLNRAENSAAKKLGLHPKGNTCAVDVSKNSQGTITVGGTSGSDNAVAVDTGVCSKETEIINKYQSRKERKRLINKMKNEENMNKRPIESEDIRNDEFLLMAERMSNTAEKHSVQKQQLNETLRKGYDAFENKYYRRAIDCYREALKIVTITPFQSLGINDTDVVIIEYILNLARVESRNYEKIVQAIRDIKDRNHISVPAFHYLLGKAYYNLNRYKNALEALNQCLEFLQSLMPFSEYSWPSTSKVIPETTREGLEESVMTLIHSSTSCPEKPIATCRYERCFEISSHIVPCEFIFNSDPDFIGYVTVFCEEKCRVQYHVQCWKAFKESFSSCGKIHEKDMLDKACPTEKCQNPDGGQSKIRMIVIVGQDGNIKSQIKFDIPVKPVLSKNSRKQKLKQSEENNEKPLRMPMKSKLRKTKADKEISENKPSTVVASAATISSVTAHTSSVVTTNARTAVSQDIVTSSLPTSTSETVEDSLKKRLNVLSWLRNVGFGYDADNVWNPQEEFYGRSDERSKKENKIFTFNDSGDISVRQGYKDFLFSWFQEILSKDGPTKIAEIQEQWTSCTESGADNFLADIKSVFSDVDDVCDLLLESTRFCLIDDNLCLSEQLPETYNDAKVELIESVSFMLVDSLEQHKLNQDQTKIVSLTTEDPDAKALIDIPDVLKDNQNYINNSDKNIEAYYSDSSSGDANDNADSVGEGEKDDLSDLDKKSTNGQEVKSYEIKMKEFAKKGIEDNLNENKIHVDTERDKTKTCSSDENFNPLKKKHNDFELQRVDKEIDTRHYIDQSVTANIQLTTEDKILQTDCKVSEASAILEGNQILQNDVQVEVKVQVKTEDKLLQTDEEGSAILEENKKLQRDIQLKTAEIQRLQAEIDQINKSKAETIDCYKSEIDIMNEKMKMFIEMTTKKVTDYEKMAVEFQELRKKKHADNFKRLELEYLHCDSHFNLTSRKIEENLSVLRNILKWNELPCHSEVKESISKLDMSSDKLSQCKIRTNLLYEQLKGLIQAGIDLDGKDSLLPNVTEVITGLNLNGIDYDSLINQLFQKKLEAIMKCNVGQIDVIENVDQIEQSLAQFSDTTEDTDATSIGDSFVSIYGSTSSKGVEPDRDVNEEAASVVSVAEKVDTIAVETDVATASHDIEIQSTKGRASKRKKKNKTNKPGQEQVCQQASVSGGIPTLINVPSIWGTTELQPQLDPIESSAANMNDEGEWQVCMDRRTLREQSQAALPMITNTSKGKGHYFMLMDRLKNRFTMKTEKELSAAVKSVREKNNSSLSGLSMDDIENRVERLLMEKTAKKPGTMGLEKFGETVWGGGCGNVMDSVWQGSSGPAEECVICCDDERIVDLTSLECNHRFHTECIRQWLKEKSVCPLCNKYSKMPDEFPAL